MLSRLIHNHPQADIIEQQRFTLFVDEVWSRMIASALAAVLFGLFFQNAAGSGQRGMWFASLLVVAICSWLALRKIKTATNTSLPSIRQWHRVNMLLSVLWGCFWAYMPFVFLSDASQQTLSIALLALVIISAMPSISMGCYPEIYITFLTPVFLSLGYNIQLQTGLAHPLVYLCCMAWAALSLFSLLTHKNQVALIIKSVELGTMFQKMKSSNLEKDYLIAAIGHDLRQPMASAKLYLEVLAEKQQDNSAARNALNATEVALNGLHDALSMVSLKEQDEVLRLSRFNPADLLAKVVQDVRTVKPETAISSNYQAAILTSDAFALARIIENILYNYVHHAPIQGLHIATSADTHHYQLHFSASETAETGAENRQDHPLQGYGLIMIEHMCRAISARLRVYRDKGSWQTTLLIPLDHSPGILESVQEAELLQ
ncbi:hypothetical protein [Halopseudomonas aestusnigri]|jgi:signal transduction histidine kinase|uniref:sensor histidine kinase n=1 Tax=Halopseudomonas aestusnigri TaxID=857252 RepID=UPI000C8A8D09|nr:hypothetical protein [Pseudomonadales bacterium]GMQ54337.1 HAMP domain-containing sensor histidine kinase [Halopseudomonas aestusnigri]|tara:strand:+ start:480 stop:1772 length:1293 start_codon:yes stop_codon:yes gene_type:complete